MGFEGYAGAITQATSDHRAGIFRRSRAFATQQHVSETYAGTGV